MYFIFARSIDYTHQQHHASHTWGDQEITYQEMAFLQKTNRLPAELRKDRLYVASLVAAAGLNFSDTNKDSIRRRRGVEKVQQTAVIARSRGLDYCWLDTCCIDKTSTAELQEAINSMYPPVNQRATYCAVHLEDQPRRFDSVWSRRVFQDARTVTMNHKRMDASRAHCSSNRDLLRLGLTCALREKRRPL